MGPNGGAHDPTPIPTTEPGSHAPHVPALAPPAASALGPDAPPGTPAPGPNAGPALSPVALLRALRRRWALALTLGLVLGSVAGAGLWFVRPPRYTATALLQVSPAPMQVLPTTAAEREHSDDRNFQKTQAAIIKSRKILRATLGDAEVASLPLFRGEPDPAVYLEKELQVAFIEGTDIVRISLTGPYPADVAKVVNAVKKAYLDQAVLAEHTKQLSLLTELKTVYGKSEETIRDKRKMLRELAETLKTSDTAALTLKQKIILDEYAALKRELGTLKSQVRALTIKVQLQKAALASPATFEVPASLVAAELDKDPLVKKELDEVTKLQDLAAKAAAVVRADAPTSFGSGQAARLTQAQEALDKARAGRREAVTARVRQTAYDAAKRVLANDEAQLRVLERQKKALEDEVAEKSGEAENIGVKSFELEMRRGEIEQTEILLRSLRAQQERLNIEMQVTKHRVVAVTDAEVPEVPDRNIQVQLAGVGGAGMFLLTLGGVAYWELRRRHITGGDELAQDVGLRVIGSLPAFDPARGRAPALLDRTPEDGRWIESIDSIRTMLLYGQNSTQRVLMITSAKAREGKTTLAAQLATSIARTGRRTVLVDCDLRRPSAHELLGVEAAPGLSEVLADELAVSQAVAPSPLPSLSILQAGLKAPAMVAALSRGRVGPVFNELRSRFDFVVVDCAPVLPVADALLVGKDVDGVVFSVRPYFSQTPLVVAACDRLAALGIPILGVVVNGTRTPPKDYESLYYDPEARPE